MPLLAVLSLAPALASAQEVVGWGWKKNGESIPPPSVQSDVVQVSAGYGFSVALKADGTVVVWGDDLYGRLDIPPAAQSGVVAISAGFSNTLVLKQDGSVISWGDSFKGANDVPAAAQSGVVAIAAGQHFGAALKANGSVVCWGNNEDGQCDVPPEAQSGVKAISAGDDFMLALKNDGSVIAWGSNQYGQTAVPTYAQSGVTAISAGSSTAMILKDGGVKLWGSMGPGDEAPLAAQSDVVSIDAGTGEFIAVKSNGKLIWWGFNKAPDPKTYPVLPFHAEPVQSGILSGSVYGLHALALRAQAWATLDQPKVYEGMAATGTVHLANPAGLGGVTVGLVADNAAVNIPASVNVPQGATTATFPMTVGALADDASATIRTSYNGSATVPAIVKLKAIPVGLDFNVNTIFGGSTENLTLTVTTPSPVVADTTFALAYDSLLSGPATVTVPVGQSSAQVSLTSSFVGSLTSAAVQLKKDGVVKKTRALLLKPITVLKLTGQGVTGGTSPLTLTLSAQLRYDLMLGISCDNPAVSAFPINVSAGTNGATFPVSVAPTNTESKSTLRINIYGKDTDRVFSIVTSSKVASIELPGTIYGKTKVAGSVVLNGPAPAGGLSVALATDPGSPLTVPYAVFVPEGQTSATFDVTADDVSGDTPATIKATLGKTVTKNVTVKENGFLSFVYSADTVKGGESITATLTLMAPVASNTTIILFPNDSHVILPTGAIILAGQQSVTFTVKTHTTDTPIAALITAMRNGKSIAKSFTITP